MTVNVLDCGKFNDCEHILPPVVYMLEFEEELGCSVCADFFKVMRSTP